MQEHVVTIKGKKVFYIEENTKAKRVLIMLHGIGGTSKSFTPLFNHINQDKDLRLIALDFPGRGSTRLKNNTIASFAKWVKDFIEHNQFKKVNLMGMSLGGAVALKFAHKYPEKLNKLIVQAPPISSKVIGKSRRPAIFFALKALDRETLVKVINKARTKDRWLGGFVKLFAAVNRGWKNKVYEPLGEENIMYIIKNNDLTVLRELIKDLNEFDIVDVLHEIKVPTLALMGGKDSAINPDSLKTIKKFMPNVKAKFLPKEDHMMVIVNPKVVTKEVLKFLE